jgi:hypothetical protein
MELDQLVQDEYPNQHEQVSLDHFYQIQLRLHHYVLLVIQQHNNDVA